MFKHLEKEGNILLFYRFEFKLQFFMCSNRILDYCESSPFIKLCSRGPFLEIDPFGVLS